MHRPLLTLLTVLVCCLPFNLALAFDIDSAGLDLGIGYRSDSLDWSIAKDLDGGEPNILSELTWDNIKILQLQGSGWLKLSNLSFIDNEFLIVSNISMGKIFSGDVQDSDYAKDQRAYEWSRSVGDADHGMTADLSAAVGPIFELNNNSGLSLTPLVGYAFSLQGLNMSDGEQVISEAGIRREYFPAEGMPSAVGKITGLDSSYNAYWYGPWVGLNTGYQVGKKFKVAAGIEYHWVNYFAQADWNLRSDFDHPVSFEHDANGTGVVWNLKGEYLLNPKWSLLIKGSIQRWKTDDGTDRTFFADGTVGKTRLNPVHWDSTTVTTGVQCSF